MRGVFGDGRRRFSLGCEFVRQISLRRRFVKLFVRSGIKQVLREGVVSIAGKLLPGNGKKQPVGNHAQSNEERDESRGHEWENVYLIQGHQKGDDGCAESDRRGDYTGPNPAQTLFFGRFQKLFERRQDVFGNLLEFFRRAHLANFVCHGHPDMLARRNRRLRDRVRVLQRVSHDPQVRAAGPAELAQLSFFRTAGWAVHVGGLYGKSPGKFRRKKAQKAQKIELKQIRFVLFVPFCGWIPHAKICRHLAEVLPMKKLCILALVFGFFCFSEPSILAQDKPAEQPTAEDQEKKAEREKNAYRLLDQVLDEAQSLRLTENRVRVQINAADLLWDQNQGRARSMFTMAGEGVAEMGRIQTSFERRGAQNPDGSGRPNMRAFQLRQELVLAAARHDAALAYQLLAATKPPASPQPVEQRGPRAPFTSEENLEQTLLARIAALDPKLAAQNAEQMLEKGQFPRTLSEVINQLARQDPEAAKKLADKTVKRVQAANLLTNSEAAALVQALLSPGPRQPSSATQTATTQFRGRAPSLEQSAYVDLLSSAIDAALKATPAQSQRGPANQGRGPGRTGPQQPTDAQIEQNNARRLLAGLQVVLPMVDQYLPAKAPVLRQKLTEMGMSTNPGMTFNGIQGNPTADALVQAAATAPQQVQSRLYQQAAYKALEEGDADRARQIATDHLSQKARDSLMDAIQIREMAKKPDGARLEEIRQVVAKLQNDDDKLNLLLQVADDAQKENPKLAVQLLDEARQMTNRRATGYNNFEQQLRVAHAFAPVDPARSFEILDQGISHLNELLGAAAVLSGFEINMFRDGEMALQDGNGLTRIINQYGRELAVLARSDFERAETLASRFQVPESRIMTRLAIVQGLLAQTPPDQTRITVRQD